MKFDTQNNNTIILELQFYWDKFSNNVRPCELRKLLKDSSIFNLLIYRHDTCDDTSLIKKMK